MKRGGFDRKTKAPTNLKKYVLLPFFLRVSHNLLLHCTHPLSLVSNTIVHALDNVVQFIYPGFP